MKKWFALLVFFVLAGGLGWQIYRRAGQSPPETRAGGSRPVAVLTAPVERGVAREMAEFTGTLIASSRVTLAAKVAGRLAALTADLGDRVEPGQLVAALDPADYEQEVAQAQANLEVAAANLTEQESALAAAERDYLRFQQLREQEVASESELDQAQARFRAAQAKRQVAEAQIKQRQAALRAAELRLSYTEVRAPASQREGVGWLVAERLTDQGELLRANDPIVSLIDSRSVLAVVYVVERDFPRIRIGQAASVTVDAYPGRAFEGRIARFAPLVREESRQARVEIEIDNREGALAPGMFARARLQFTAKSDVPLIPVSALVRRNGETGVFMLDAEPARARFVAVETGIVDGDRVEILDPEFSGRVIVLGQHLLEDGAAVSAAEGI